MTFTAAGVLKFAHLLSTRVTSVTSVPLNKPMSMVTFPKVTLPQPKARYVLSKITAKIERRVIC